MSFQSHPIGMRLTWPLLSKAAFGSIISSAFLPSPVRAQSACPNPVPVTIAPPNLDAPSATLVPNDVCTPKQIPGGNPIAYFDDYSWRTFVALVWPGLSGHRGTPDTVESLSKANVPVVFETYKADWETFQPDGAQPTAWSDMFAASMPCPNAKPGDFVLSSFTKFGNVGEAGIGSFTAVLIAQNGTFARYLAAYNEVEFTAIRANKWYLATNLPGNQAPPTKPIVFSSGALDVKSSWIDMTNIPDPERYHTRDAWLQDPISGKCGDKPVRVGLVGLHIVQKTPSRPQWIWSTFEGSVANLECGGERSADTPRVHAARMSNCSANEGRGLKAYLAWCLRIMPIISMPPRIVRALSVDLKPNMGRTRLLMER